MITDHLLFCMITGSQSYCLTMRLNTASRNAHSNKYKAVSDKLPLRESYYANLLIKLKGETLSWQEWWNHLSCTVRIRYRWPSFIVYGHNCLLYSTLRSRVIRLDTTESKQIFLFDFNYRNAFHEFVWMGQNVCERRNFSCP